MENTYWNHNGTHETLANELQKLIPTTGEIKGSKNKALDRFRRAVNAYYDIFNNGGCNRGHSIGKFFGRDVNHLLRQMYKDRAYFNRIDGWGRIAQVTEPVMDKIILAAASEQGIQ